MKRIIKMDLNKKYILLTISGILLVGIVFSVVQITKAGSTGPHNPGHDWATIDKPNDCTSGKFVTGADDAGWLCDKPKSELRGLYEAYNSGFVGSPDICYADSGCTISLGYRVRGTTALLFNAGGLITGTCAYVMNPIGPACTSLGGTYAKCAGGLTKRCTITGEETGRSYYLCSCVQ